MERAAYSLAIERNDLVRIVAPFETLPATLELTPAPLLDQSLLESDARDLVRVGAAVFTADKLALRALPRSRGRRRELAWQRRIDLTLPVENVDRWRAAGSDLIELLSFLTDDTWSVRFEAHRPLPPTSRPLFEDPDLGCQVALCSQGLDSALGAALTQTDRQPLVLASVITSGPQHRAILELVATLKSLGIDVRHVGQWVRVLRHKAPENTQRTRGLLFLLVGAASASALGATSIKTFENGVGALNLPVNQAQVGAQNTRSMHPRTLLLMERLLGKVLDHPVHVDAPFQLMTKGEMCQATGDRLAVLARTTMSCDEGNNHKNKTNLYEHCGLCTSCLMRRSAVHAVPGFKDPTVYRGQATHSHGRFEVESFEYQAERLAALTNWDDLLDLDPVARHVESRIFQTQRDMGQREVRSAVLSLLHRHATEARAFLAHAHPAVAPHVSRPRAERGPLDLFKATG